MMEGPSLTGLKDGSFESLEFQVDLNGITPAELANLHAGDFANLSFTSDINGVTPTELSYVQGATSSLQSQINGLVAGSLGSSDLNVNSITATTSISTATLSVGGVSYATTIAAKQDTLTTSSTPYVQDIRLTTADSMGGAVNSTGLVGIQLQDLWDRAGDLGSDITTLQTDLGTLEGTVSGLDTDLTSVETDVATLQAEMLTKIESLEIGTVTSVSYGSAPTVTIDNTDPLHPLLSFALRQGNPGPTGATGAQGPQGDPGSDADVGPLAAIVAGNTAGIAAGVVVATALQAQVSAVAATAAANNAAISALGTEVGVLDGELTTVMAHVINFQSAVPSTSTNHAGTLNIKDPTGFTNQVVLGSTVESQFYNGLHSAHLTSGGALDVAGASSLGDVTITGLTQCDGNFTASAQANFDGVIIASNDLFVTGLAAFDSTLSVAGNLTASANAAVDGVLSVQELDVYGATHLGTLSATGDCTLGSSLANHTISGVSLTVTCPFVSIPFLSVPSYSSFPSGYSLSY